MLDCHSATVPFTELLDLAGNFKFIHEPCCVLRI